MSPFETNGPGPNSSDDELQPRQPEQGSEQRPAEQKLIEFVLSLMSERTAVAAGSASTARSGSGEVAYFRPDGTPISSRDQRAGDPQGLVITRQARPDNSVFYTLSGPDGTPEARVESRPTGRGGQTLSVFGAGSERPSVTITRRMDQSGTGTFDVRFPGESEDIHSQTIGVERGRLASFYGHYTVADAAGRPLRWDVRCSVNDGVVDSSRTGSIDGIEYRVTRPGESPGAYGPLPPGLSQIVPNAIFQDISRVLPAILRSQLFPNETAAGAEQHGARALEAFTSLLTRLREAMGPGVGTTSPSIGEAAEVGAEATSQGPELRADAASEDDAAPEFVSFTAPVDLEHSDTAPAEPGSSGAAPVAVAVEAPAAVSVDAPAAVSVEAPAAVPVEAPAAVPVEAPAAVPVEAPAAVPVEAPAAVAVEAPAAVAVEAPAAVPVVAARITLFQQMFPGVAMPRDSEAPLNTLSFEMRAQALAFRALNRPESAEANLAALRLEAGRDGNRHVLLWYMRASTLLANERLTAAISSGNQIERSNALTELARIRMGRFNGLPVERASGCGAVCSVIDQILNGTTANPTAWRSELPSVVTRAANQNASDTNRGANAVTTILTTNDPLVRGRTFDSFVELGRNGNSAVIQTASRLHDFVAVSQLSDALAAPQINAEQLNQALAMMGRASAEVQRRFCAVIGQCMQPNSNPTFEDACAFVRRADTLDTRTRQSLGGLRRAYPQLMSEARALAGTGDAPGDLLGAGDAVAGEHPSAGRERITALTQIYARFTETERAFLQPNATPEVRARQLAALRDFMIRPENAAALRDIRLASDLAALEAFQCLANLHQTTNPANTAMALRQLQTLASSGNAVAAGYIEQIARTTSGGSSGQPIEATLASLENPTTGGAARQSLLERLPALNAEREKLEVRSATRNLHLPTRPSAEDLQAIEARLQVLAPGNAEARRMLPFMQVAAVVRELNASSSPAGMEATRRVVPNLRAMLNNPEQAPAARQALFSILASCALPTEDRSLWSASHRSGIGYSVPMAQLRAPYGEEAAIAAQALGVLRDHLTQPGAAPLTERESAALALVTASGILLSAEDRAFAGTLLGSAIRANHAPAQDATIRAIQNAESPAQAEALARLYLDNATTINPAHFATFERLAAQGNRTSIDVLVRVVAGEGPQELRTRAQNAIVALANTPELRAIVAHQMIRLPVHNAAVLHTLGLVAAVGGEPLPDGNQSRVLALLETGVVTNRAEAGPQLLAAYFANARHWDVRTAQYAALHIHGGSDIDRYSEHLKSMPAAAATAFVGALRERANQSPQLTLAFVHALRVLPNVASAADVAALVNIPTTFNGPPPMAPEVRATIEQARHGAHLSILRSATDPVVRDAVFESLRNSSFRRGVFEQEEIQLLANLARSGNQADLNRLEQIFTSRYGLGVQPPLALVLRRMGVSGDDLAAAATDLTARMGGGEIGDRRVREAVAGFQLFNMLPPDLRERVLASAPAVLRARLSGPANPLIPPMAYDASRFVSDARSGHLTAEHLQFFGSIQGLLAAQRTELLAEVAAASELQTNLGDARRRYLTGLFGSLTDPTPQQFRERARREEGRAPDTPSKDQPPGTVPERPHRRPGELHDVEGRSGGLPSHETYLERQDYFLPMLTRTQTSLAEAERRLRAASEGLAQVDSLLLVSNHQRLLSSGSLDRADEVALIGWSRSIPATSQYFRSQLEHGTGAPGSTTGLNRLHQHGLLPSNQLPNPNDAQRGAFILSLETLPTNNGTSALARRDSMEGVWRGLGLALMPTDPLGIGRSALPGVAGSAAPAPGQSRGGETLGTHLAALPGPLGGDGAAGRINHALRARELNRFIESDDCRACSNAIRAFESINFQELVQTAATSGRLTPELTARVQVEARRVEDALNQLTPERVARLQANLRTLAQSGDPNLRQMAESMTAFLGEVTKPDSRIRTMLQAVRDGHCNTPTALQSFLREAADIAAMAIAASVIISRGGSIWLLPVASYLTSIGTGEAARVVGLDPTNRGSAPGAWLRGRGEFDEHGNYRPITLGQVGREMAVQLGTDYAMLVGLRAANNFGLAINPRNRPTLSSAEGTRRWLAARPTGPQTFGGHFVEQLGVGTAFSGSQHLGDAAGLSEVSAGFLYEFLRGVTTRRVAPHAIRVSGDVPGVIRELSASGHIRVSNGEFYVHLNGTNIPLFRDSHTRLTLDNVRVRDAGTDLNAPPRLAVVDGPLEPHHSGSTPEPAGRPGVATEAERRHISALDEQLNGLARSAEAALNAGDTVARDRVMQEMQTILLAEARRIARRMGLPEAAITPEVVRAEFLNGVFGLFAPGSARVQVDPRHPGQLDTLSHEMRHLGQALRRNALRLADPRAFEAALLESCLRNVGNGEPLHTANLTRRISEMRQNYTAESRQLMRQALTEYVRQRPSGQPGADQLAHMEPILARPEFASLLAELGGMPAAVAEMRLELGHIRAVQADAGVSAEALSRNPAMSRWVTEQAARLSAQRAHLGGSLANHPEMRAYARNLSESSTGMMHGPHPQQYLTSLEEVGSRRSGLAETLREIVATGRRHLTDPAQLREFILSRGGDLIASLQWETALNRVVSAVHESQRTTGPQSEAALARARVDAEALLRTMDPSAPHAALFIGFCLDRGLTTRDSLRPELRDVAFGPRTPVTEGEAGHASAIQPQPGAPEPHGAPAEAPARPRFPEELHDYHDAIRNGTLDDFSAACELLGEHRAHPGVQAAIAERIQAELNANPYLSREHVNALQQRAREFAMNDSLAPAIELYRQRRGAAPAQQVGIALEVGALPEQIVQTLRSNGYQDVSHLQSRRGVHAIQYRSAEGHQCILLLREGSTNVNQGIRIIDPLNDGVLRGPGQQNAAFRDQLTDKIPEAVIDAFLAGEGGVTTRNCTPVSNHAGQLVLEVRFPDKLRTYVTVRRGADGVREVRVEHRTRTPEEQGRYLNGG